MSTAVSAGLTWSQAWAAIIVGYFVIAFLVVITARIGAVYHISFPILARSSFGVWCVLWPVIQCSAILPTNHLSVVNRGTTLLGPRLGSLWTGV